MLCELMCHIFEIFCICMISCFICRIVSYNHELIWYTLRSYDWFILEFTIFRYWYFNQSCWLSNINFNLNIHWLCDICFIDVPLTTHSCLSMLHYMFNVSYYFCLTHVWIKVEQTTPDQETLLGIKWRKFSNCHLQHLAMMMTITQTSTTSCVISFSFVIRCVFCFLFL